MTAWTLWNYTDDKPYPETMTTIIDVRFSDGDEWHYAPVKTWWSDKTIENLYKPIEGSPDNVTHYRISE